MKIILYACVLTFAFTALARGAAPMAVQDFEDAGAVAKVWAVGIPQSDATASVSTEHPHDGKKCLELKYRFTDKGQYLGVANEVKLDFPVRRVHFWIYGDGSNCGYGLYLLDASEEVHKFRDAGAMKLDFKGWKEAVVDVTGSHESWGGDKNGTIDLPIKGITFEISHSDKEPVQGSIFFDGISVERDATVIARGHRVDVKSPDYCSEVQGDARIELSAPGFRSIEARCWKQGPGAGADSTVATLDLDADGDGAFVFPAEQYPHGPLTLRLAGRGGGAEDVCCLQLYNKGGVAWNQGIPKDPPAAVRDMQLVFQDDFTAPPPISGKNPDATYFDHKPRGGDFSTLPFTSFEEKNNPFAQLDTCLRIRADAKKRSAGIISSVNNDGKGITASVPCYFECRFIGPNAIGTWPAFWLMTNYPADRVGAKRNVDTPADELDVVEAYGGEGPHSPNAHDRYMVTPHAWAQGSAGHAIETAAFEAMHNPIVMGKFKIPSTWYDTFHTYGCLVTADETVYYCDDIEVARHKTMPISKSQPLFFMINLATGGGWPVDLSRYDGKADMYIDFVRVFQGRK